MNNLDRRARERQQREDEKFISAFAARYGIQIHHLYELIEVIARKANLEKVK